MKVTTNVKETLRGSDSDFKKAADDRIELINIMPRDENQTERSALILS